MIINEKLKERNLKLDSLYEAKWMDRQMKLEDLGLEGDNLEKGIDMLADIAKEMKEAIDKASLNLNKLKLIDKAAAEFIENVKIVLADDNASVVIKFYNIAIMTRISEQQIGIFE